MSITDNRFDIAMSKASTELPGIPLGFSISGEITEFEIEGVEIVELKIRRPLPGLFRIRNWPLLDKQYLARLIAELQSLHGQMR